MPNPLSNSIITSAGAIQSVIQMPPIITYAMMDLYVSNPTNALCTVSVNIDSNANSPALNSFILYQKNMTQTSSFKLKKLLVRESEHITLTSSIAGVVARVSGLTYINTNSSLIATRNTISVANATETIGLVGPTSNYGIADITLVNNTVNTITATLFIGDSNTPVNNQFIIESGIIVPGNSSYRLTNVIVAPNEQLYVNADSSGIIVKTDILQSL